jgi:hypothetical protein
VASHVHDARDSGQAGFDAGRGVGGWEVGSGKWEVGMGNGEWAGS